MRLNEILYGSAGVLVVILTIIQIAPLQVNPWSCIARALGKAFNGDVIAKVDKITEDMSSIKADIHQLEASNKNLEYRIAESDAIACRARIVRFGDELYHKQHHTKEHFEQVLNDITQYQNFCRDHEDFTDTIAEITIEQIKKAYSDLFMERKFL